MQNKEYNSEQINLELMLENDWKWHCRTITENQALSLFKGYDSAKIHFECHRDELRQVVKDHNEYVVKRNETEPGFMALPIPEDPILFELSMFSITLSNRLKLPETKLNHYPKIKKLLIDAGGRYRNNGFDFDGDAEKILRRLLSGEKVNDKKKFQIFETVPSLVEKARSIANIQPGELVLEPSAGSGNLIEGIDKEYVDCVELNEANRATLVQKGYRLVGSDFLELNHLEHKRRYDCIIANPPFCKNQDIDHIMHMFEFLKPGGRLVAFSSMSWKTGSQKKQRLFQDWVSSLDADIEEIGRGEFKESGTNVATLLISLVKPIGFSQEKPPAEEASSYSDNSILIDSSTSDECSELVQMELF